MISVFYASILALLICWLALNVIKIRRKRKISIGDAGNKELIAAISAHSNAIEYIPIALILMFALEWNQADLLLLHIAGFALVVGRAIHAHAMLTKNLKTRVLGMQITIFTIFGLVAGNFLYLPYSKLFAF